MCYDGVQLSVSFTKLPLLLPASLKVHVKEIRRSIGRDIILTIGPVV